MLWFSPPKANDFFDNRILISWKINQPKELSPLVNLRIAISSDPPIKFDPPQQSNIKIPNLNGNEIIVNWVIQTPKIKTKINLSLECKSFSENQFIILDPNNLELI